MISFDEACRLVLYDAKTDGYAKAYARAGLGMEGNERRVQALYILSNIERWRGDRAKEVRTALKKHGEVR